MPPTRRLVVWFALLISGCACPPQSVQHAQTYTAPKGDPLAKLAPPQDHPGTYIVQEGDSLAKLALRFYGTPAKADLIYEANREGLEAPDRMHPGMILIIPDIVPDAK